MKRMPTNALTMMTDRERYLAALLYQKPDRVPFMPGHGRRSTRENWHRQGLPADVEDYHTYVCQLIGIDPPARPTLAPPEVRFTMIPEFEEKVIEHRKPPA